MQEISFPRNHFKCECKLLLWTLELNIKEWIFGWKYFSNINLNVECIFKRDIRVTLNIVIS